MHTVAFVVCPGYGLDYENSIVRPRYAHTPIHTPLHSTTPLGGFPSEYCHPVSTLVWKN